MSLNLGYIQSLDGLNVKIVFSLKFLSWILPMKKSNLPAHILNSKDKVEIKNIHSKSNFTKLSIANNPNGIKQDSISCSSSKNKIKMHPSGPEWLKLMSKINTFKSTGPNGLTKIKKNKIPIKDSEVLILPKCKASQEWEVWEAWEEWEECQEWEAWCQVCKEWAMKTMRKVTSKT